MGDRSGKRHGGRIPYAIKFREFTSLLKKKESRPAGKQVRYVYVFVKKVSSDIHGFYISWRAELVLINDLIFEIPTSRYKRSKHYKRRLINKHDTPTKHYTLLLHPKDDHAAYFLLSREQLPAWRLEEYFGKARRKKGSKQLVAGEPARMEDMAERLARRAVRFQPDDETFLKQFVDLAPGDVLAGEPPVLHTLHLVDFQGIVEHYQDKALRKLDALRKHVKPGRNRTQLRYLGGLTQGVVESLPKKKQDKWIDREALKRDVDSYDRRARSLLKSAEKYNTWKLNVILGKSKLLEKNPYIGNGYPEVRDDMAPFRKKGQKHPRKHKKDEVDIAKDLEEAWAAHQDDVLAETSQTPGAFRLLIKELKKPASWYNYFMTGEKVFASSSSQLSKVSKTASFFKEMMYAEFAGFAAEKLDIQAVNKLKGATSRWGLYVDTKNGVRYYRLEHMDALGLPVKDAAKVAAGAGAGATASATAAAAAKVEPIAELTLPVPKPTDKNKVAGHFKDMQLTEWDAVELQQRYNRYQNVDEVAKIPKALANVLQVIEVVNLFLAVQSLYASLKGRDPGKITEEVIKFSGAVTGPMTALATLISKHGWSEGSKSLAGRFVRSAALKWAGVTIAGFTYGLDLWKIGKASYAGKAGETTGLAVSAAGGVALTAAGFVGMGLGSLSLVGVAALTGVGLALVIVGGLIAYFFSEPEDPPLVTWLKSCPWSKTNPGRGRLKAQTADLVRLAFSPRVTVKFEAGKATLIIKPAFFVPKETTFEVQEVEIVVTLAIQQRDDKVIKDLLDHGPVYRIKEKLKDAVLPGSGKFTKSKDGKRFVRAWSGKDWTWQARGNHEFVVKVKIVARFRKEWKKTKPYQLVGSEKRGAVYWDGTMGLIS